MRAVSAVLGALFLLTAQAPGPPVPVASALPEIGRTRAKGFCATVRDNVAPSLLGLMKTDELIGASHRAMLKMSHDRGSPDAQQIDRLYTEKVVAAMAHNLGVVKKLLADEKRFPKKPLTDDDRFALLLKAQLQDAADRQNVALNHVNGILETTAMGEMRSSVNAQMTGALSQPGAPPATGSDQFLGAPSLPGAGPGGFADKSAPATSNVVGNTIWDKLALDIEVQQTRIAGAEQTLTPTVIAASAACRPDTTASPAP